METYVVEMNIDPASPVNPGSGSVQPGTEQSDTLAQENWIYERFLSQWTIVNFFRAVEAVLIPWAMLLKKTTPPDDALSTDHRFLVAFNVLDAALDAQEDSGRLLSRLAHVQLYRFIKLLETRVASDRQAGLIHRRNGYNNSHIVLDMYMSAQTHPLPSRDSLIQRKCLAKKWHNLAGAWPVFVLVYSEDADNIMFGPGQVLNA